MTAMKIQSQPASMLERLQDVYSDEQAQVNSAKGGRFHGPPSTDAPKATSATSLEIQHIALDAIHGKIGDERAVRERVVDHVIIQKFGNIPEEKAASIKELLVDDPEFTRRVEDMLSLALREIARSER